MADQEIQLNSTAGSEDAAKDFKRFSDMVISFRAKAAPTGPTKDMAVLSNAIPEVEDRDKIFEQAGALAPPYDPEALVLLAEESSSVPQNLAAMKTNIDGYGWRLEPVIDPKSSKARTKAVQDLYLRARAEGKPVTTRPSEAEIDAFLEDLTFRMELEEAVITSFINECAGEGDISFTELRMVTREETECTGNGYWEVLRHPESREIQGFVRLPAISMRITPIDLTPTKVERPYKISDTCIGKKTSFRYYRRFVQEYMGQVVYFKEFGDPRNISAKTGKELSPGEAQDAQEIAHEVLHFKVTSLRSPYGIPRWIGVLYAVLGNRAAEEINYTYFDNNTLGPMALLVSGAHVTPDTIKRIESDIAEMKKGRENFHNILILAAESNPQQGHQPTQVKMELKPMNGAQQHDGQFMKYIAENKDAVGASFRQPRILTGVTDGANRASNDAALRFAEQQVYQPERNRFDDLVNRLILLDLGLVLWKFVSNSPLASDPQTQATIIQGFTNSGVLTPKEARVQAAQVLNTELEDLQAEWVKQPLTLSLAQISQAKKTPQTTTPGNAEQVREQKPMGGRKPDGSEALEGIPPQMNTTPPT